MLPADLRRRMPTRSRRRGAMAAELALLVSLVYVPLIFGAIYVGWLSSARSRVQDANHLLLFKYTDDDQFANGGRDDAMVDTVKRSFFPEFPGDGADALVGDAKDVDVPGPNELQKLFEAYKQVQHWERDSAHGRFELQGSNVVYIENIVHEEGDNMRPEGAIVEKYGLDQDDVPRLTTHTLWWGSPEEDPTTARYMRRRKAHTSYLLSWKEGGRNLDREAWSVSEWNQVRDDVAQGLYGQDWSQLTPEEQQRVESKALSMSPWINRQDPMATHGPYSARTPSDRFSRPWNLKVPSDNVSARDYAEGLLGWFPECAVRFWDYQRLSRNPMPPGITMRRWIACPIPERLDLSDPYERLEDIEDFWHPCEGPPETAPGPTPPTPPPGPTPPAPTP